MPLTPTDTSLYTLGKGIVSIEIWNGSTPPSDPYVDVGNTPSFEVEVTEELLDHFSSRSGARTKDKTVVLETGYTLNFELDEIALINLQIYLKATLSGTHVLLANTVLDAEYAIKFVADNAAGPNETWVFWRCKLSPNGAFSLIGDEWAALSFTAEGLSDTANNPTSPYFTVTYSSSSSSSLSSSSSSSSCSSSSISSSSSSSFST